MKIIFQYNQDYWRKSYSYSIKIILFAFLFASCLSILKIEAAEPRHGGKFRTNISEPRSLTPTVEVSSEVYSITGNIYNGLLRWNQDASDVELDLASSWKKVDDLTYVFKIHSGVYFHNIPPVSGREVTSKDVKFTIEWAMGMFGEKYRFIHRYYFENRISSIETPDKYTIVIKTKEPYAPFIAYLASARSVILPKEILDKYGNFNRNAIGTGPFILKEYLQGSHASLIKNSNYFRKPYPYLEEIELKIINDPPTLLAAFLANQLDSFGPSFFQLETLKQKNPDVQIIQRPGTHQWILRVRPYSEKNLLKPPLNELKVRQAIAMAIDKDKLLKLSLGGAGQVQVGPIPNWPPYSLTEKDQVEYNPSKARQLLAEAGYPEGFSIDLLTWSANYMTTPAQIIQAMLKDVGISLNLRFLEMAQYFNYIYKTGGDFDLNLHVMTAGVEPDEWLTCYFSENSTAYKWNNPEIWRLCAEQARAINKNRRIALIQEVQRKILFDASHVFLYSQTRFTAMKPYVHRILYFNEYQPLMGENLWMDEH